VDDSTKRKEHSLVRNEEGGAMVEFAIAGSVFIAMLLGILEFGFAAWEKNGVAADAREGARYAMVHGSQSGQIADTTMVSDYVKARTKLDNSIVVTTTWVDATKQPGTLVSVRVTHAVPRRGPFLRAHTDSSTSTMLIVF
jgi:Flp pilus assembly protein TadG